MSKKLKFNKYSIRYQKCLAQQNAFEIAVHTASGVLIRLAVSKAVKSMHKSANI